MIPRDLHRPLESQLQIGQCEARSVPLDLNGFAWPSIRVEDREILDSFRPDVLSQEGGLRLDQPR